MPPLYNSRYHLKGFSSSFETMMIPHQTTTMEKSFFSPSHSDSKSVMMVPQGSEVIMPTAAAAESCSMAAEAIEISAEGGDIQGRISSMLAQLPQRESTQASTGKGARPKTSHRVMWSPQLVSTNSPDVLSEYKKQLMSVRCEATFFNSSAVKAVRHMLPDTASDSEELLQLATRLHKLEKHKLPKASDLLSILIDCDFEVEKIVSRFLNVRDDGHETQSNEGHSEEKSSDKSDSDSRPGTDNSYVKESDGSLDQPEDGEQRDTTDEPVPPPPAGSTQNLDEEDEGTPAAARVDEQEKMTPHKDLTEEQKLSCIARVVKREHELLVSSSKCVSCKVRPREVTFLPCGHFSLCATCSDQMYICPICQKEALAEIRTFLG